MTSSNSVSKDRSQDALFAEAQGSGIGFIGFLRFLLSAVLVFGGFYLFGSAFGPDVAAIELFMGGMAAVTIGFIIAFTTLKK